MPFINEKVSEQDIVKYGLREQDEEFRQSGKNFEWTIDRGRDIYIREMGPRGHEMPISIAYLFFWKGQRINVNIQATDFEQSQCDYAKETARILPAYHDYKPKSFWLPDSLESKRNEITQDFKEALSVYKSTGAAGFYKQYIFVLED